MTTITEQQFWLDKQWVVGIDEVGRGPLAGPVVAAAVIFGHDHQPLPDVKDSKKVPLRHREPLANAIKSQALSFGIGIGSVDIINTQGIAIATLTAMQQALDQLHHPYHHVLIDGSPFRKAPDFLGDDCSYHVKGDRHIYSIAAASILAKVYRDELMVELAKEHTGYEWESNMGYGTKNHKAAIQTLGVTPHHRTSFKLG